MQLPFKYVGFKDASEAYLALGMSELINLINGMCEEEEAKMPRIIPVKDVEPKKKSGLSQIYSQKGLSISSQASLV